MQIFVKSCARCGKDHFSEFTNLNNHETYSLWAMCPNVEQPILLKVVAMDDETDSDL